MNFANYKALCAAIGAAQKAGNNVEVDWEDLDIAIQALVGSFQADAASNVHAILHDGEGLTVQDTTAARNVVNNLCRRYGVPLVCDPDESAAQTAADVARQAAILLLGEEAG